MCTLGIINVVMYFFAYVENTKEQRLYLFTRVHRCIYSNLRINNLLIYHIDYYCYYTKVTNLNKFTSNPLEARNKAIILSF